uniref:Phosphoribosyltransferase domain-containing protein n=1 Tax=Alexandrium monilatum TaxID=311494 RepID=A0A7S4SN25_9DINO
MEAGRPAMVARYDSMMPSLRRWLIFYHESVKGTAENVKELLGEQGELSELEWHHFPDGFPNLAVQKEDAQRLESFYGTCLIISFHTPAVIFEQLCLLYALPRLGARNLRVILPWFSTGTMERVEQLGQIATAASLAKMLSACPHGPTGPATVVIYDIHALQEQFYFSDTVLVELKSAVWLLRTRLEELQKEHPDEEIAIVFPDDGAQKRFKAKFKEFPQVLCSKVREGDKRIVKIQEGTAEKRHCVIIDDLVQSGGTLMECAAPLKQQGASKVSCFVTHGVFPNSSWRKFLDGGVFHKVWITDSIPTTAAQVAGQEPFEVLSLAPLIANYLKGIADD